MLKCLPAFARFLRGSYVCGGINHGDFGRVNSVVLSVDLDRAGEDGAFTTKTDFRPLSDCVSVCIDLSSERCGPPNLDGVSASEDE